MKHNTYLGYEFMVEPSQPGTEILMAQLAEIGFESFVETDEGLSAYIQKENWDPHLLQDIQILNSDEFRISYDFKEIEQVNWNETWESSFNPILVDDTVTVRAPFHKQATTTYDLIIEPKMSFGTGHHETTHMMIQFLLRNDLENKTVLDMGCGTGVLAILAEKLGASAVDALDIDAWCYSNSLENVERNACDKITVKQGDVSLLQERVYDVIIANINRNILLQDLHKYVESLNDNGMLFLSGFYTDDIPEIMAACEAQLLKFNEIIERGQWVALKFIN